MKNLENDSNINKLVNYEYKESFNLHAIKYDGFEKTDVEETVISEYPLTLVLTMMPTGSHLPANKMVNFWEAQSTARHWTRFLITVAGLTLCRRQTVRRTVPS